MPIVVHDKTADPRTRSTAACLHSSQRPAMIAASLSLLTGYRPTLLNGESYIEPGTNTAGLLTNLSNQSRFANLGSEHRPCDEIPITSATCFGDPD